MGEERKEGPPPENQSPFSSLERQGYTPFEIGENIRAIDIRSSLLPEERPVNGSALMTEIKEEVAMELEDLTIEIKFHTKPAALFINGIKLQPVIGSIYAFDSGRLLFIAEESKPLVVEWRTRPKITPEHRLVFKGKRK